MIKALTLCCTLLLASCSGGVSDSDLIGTYVAQQGDVRQEIVVQSGGRYSNTLYKSGNVEWREDERWVREVVANRSGVTFSRFRWGLPGYSFAQGYWFVSPEKNFLGRVKLCYDLDLGRCFDRV